MEGYLTPQADYLLLVQGVVLAMLVAPALALARLETERPWRCLAGFALLGAAHSWLTILALDAGDSPAFAAGRQGLFAATFGCLALMADRSTRFQTVPSLRILRWAALALFMAMALWLGHWALAALSTALAVWGAYRLWQWSHHQPHGPQPWLRNASMALAAYGLCSGLAQVPITHGAESWHHIVPLGAALLLASATALSVILYHQKRRHAHLMRDIRARAYLRGLSWAGIVAAILALGWTASNYVEQREHHSLRHDILIRTQIAAAAISPDLIRQLDWSARDQGQPAYESIKQTLQAIVRANPDLRFAMLMGTGRGQVRFLVDSEPTDSTDYSPPGQPYDDAEPAYLEQLASGKPFLIGPIADRWGRWVTSSIPLLSLPDGRQINFDLDIAAENWDAHLRQARLPVLVITLLFAMLVLTFSRMQERVRDSLESLAISEQLHTSLVEGSPDCIQMLDRNGRFLTVNRHGLEALGYADPAQLIGRAFVDIWPAPSRPAIAQVLERTWQGHPTTTEANYTHTDGLTRTWLVSTNPLRETTGRITRLVVLCTDITKRKQIEQASLAAKEAAEATTKAKSEFFAVMSHEIRTPLGGVIGLLDLLRKRPLSPEDRYHTEVAHKSALHLLGLLDDILDAAKLEAGKLNLEAIPFNPRTELAGVIEAMRIHTEAKKLRLTLDVAADVPLRLLGDPTRLRQIVTNLLSNALKFTERGGITTRLTLQRIDGRTAHLDLSVSDTGIGIPLETQKRLFAKFEQADVSTTRRFGGTGLGLSIVRSLTQLMGGTVNLKSEPGAGTTFTISLPLVIDSTHEIPAPEIPAAPLPPHPAQLHLLCAEDDATNRLVIQTHLQAMGHHVTFAENGWLAIDRLRTTRFDAVIMDNRMPVMDGFEATHMIRDPQSGVLDHDVYIISCTANAANDYRDRCLAAGMQDFLTKPIQEAELHAALDRAIAYQRQRGCKLPPMPATEPADDAPIGLSESELLAQFDAAAAPATPASGLSQQATREIYDRFAKDAPLRLLEMRTALVLDDAPILARAAHTLKSAARYVQATTLSDLGARIETLADNGQLGDIAPLIIQLETELPRFTATLASAPRE